MKINKIKYAKIMLKPMIWHLKPYKFNDVISGNSLTIMGVLCFELIITWKTNDTKES